MKAITFRGTESVALETVPDPKIEASTDVIVKNRLTAIRGSDLHVYFGRETGNDPVLPPLSVGEMTLRRCLRCLLLVMCTYPFAKEALTLHLARSEGHERYFGCNLMHCKVLTLFHQHLIAEAPHRTGVSCPSTISTEPWIGPPSST